MWLRVIEHCNYTTLVVVHGVCLDALQYFEVEQHFWQRMNEPDGVIPTLTALGKVIAVAEGSSAAQGSVNLTHFPPKVIAEIWYVSYYFWWKVPVRHAVMTSLLHTRLSLRIIVVLPSSGVGKRYLKGCMECYITTPTRLPSLVALITWMLRRHTSLATRVHHSPTTTTGQCPFSVQF